MFPEITVDVEVIRNPCESASNRVEIDLKHERNECDDGPPPFPNTRVILNNVVNFDPHKTSEVLYSTFQDHFLRSHICCEMAGASVRYPPPFNMYLKVRHRFIDVSDPIPTTDQDNETCAICMEDMTDDGLSSQMPTCPHEFHDDCILKWLAENNVCPLCRTVYEDDSDDHPYYSSETEECYSETEDEDLFLGFSD